MFRTLPALLVLILAACSSSGSSGSSSTSSSNGRTTGAGTNGGTPGTSGGTTGTGSGGVTGASATTSGGGNGGSITVDNFNAAFNTAYCKFELSCTGGAYAPYITDAICSSGIVFLDETDLPVAVDAGRVSFDATQATACVSALSSGVCSLLSIYPCVGVLEESGIVSPAGACYSDYDCLSGTCVGNVASTCTAGTCSGLVALNGSCCASCGTCDPDAGLVCQSSDTTCVAGATVGQACGGSNPSCAFPLACNNSVCSSLPVEAGDPCSPNDGECVSGHYCYEAVSASSGNCATQVTAGQPCGEDPNHVANAFSLVDSECAGAHPVCLGAGTLMDSGVAPGICSTLSDVAGPCTPPSSAINTTDNYNDGCYYGLNCVAGACVKPPSSGPCSMTGIPCDLAASFCASATSDCTAYVAAGGTCSQADTSPCGFASTCSSPNDICQGDNVSSCSPTL